MGNTVSAAEIAASQIVHPNSAHEQNTTKHDFHKQFSYDFRTGQIPPECPMHRPKGASECPVNQGEVNPLNMVYLCPFCIKFVRIFF